MRENEDGVRRSGCGAADPKKRHRLKRGEEHVLQDGICLSLKEIVKATVTEENVLSLETQCERMLADLFKTGHCSLPQRRETVCLGRRKACV